MAELVESYKSVTNDYYSIVPILLDGKCEITKVVERLESKTIPHYDLTEKAIISLVNHCGLDELPEESIWLIDRYYYAMEEYNNDGRFTEEELVWYGESLLRLLGKKIKYEYIIEHLFPLSNCTDQEIEIACKLFQDTPLGYFKQHNLSAWFTRYVYLKFFPEEEFDTMKRVFRWLFVGFSYSNHMVDFYLYLDDVIPLSKIIEEKAINKTFSGDIAMILPSDMRRLVDLYKHLEPNAFGKRLKRIMKFIKNNFNEPKASNITRYTQLFRI